MRTALDDVVARLEHQMRRGLDERDRAATAVASEIGVVGAELATRVTEFERTLERVEQTCDLAARTVHGNRLERAALLEAIERLGPRGPATAQPHHGDGLRVVGGCVDPHDSDPDDPEREAEKKAGHEAEDTGVTVRVPAAHPAGGSRHVVRLDGVEVRCRFDGDHWVGGFEVSEVVRDGEGIRYRLRRRADGYELPRLFSSDDVRDVDPPHLHEVPRR